MSSSLSARAAKRLPMLLVALSLSLCLAARRGAAQVAATGVAAAGASNSSPGNPRSPTTMVNVGKGLYTKYCQLCHAKGGTGYAADNAPSLVSQMFLTAASDAFLARGIRLGRPNTSMAAYGTSRGGPLEDAQIDAIVAYLRSLGPRAIALPERPASGNAAHGAKLFERECRSCHGTAVKPGKAPQLHNPEFLSAASPAFLRHAILHGRPPTRMPAFEKRLSATQVDDLVAWLGSLPSQTPAPPQPAPVIPDNLPLLRHPDGKQAEFSLRDERFVSAKQVERALQAKQRIIIIDARSPADWLQFHIPGALPIPYYDAAKLDRIPNDGTWVVAYCACPHHASGEVVDALRRRNYPHTAVLDEGILFWRDQGYPLEGAAAPVGVPTPARR